MDLLNRLIKTVGLNESFFYQLLLALCLYFISKKLIFEPYIKSFKQRQSLTKGRMAGNKELDLKIEEKKALYEKKAQKIHTKFQEIFNQIRQKIQEDYLSESLKLKSAQKEQLAQKRQSLSAEIKAQEEGLKKDIPFLAKSLAEKISGKINMEKIKN